MSGGSSHTDVAAYVLGVLDETDSAVFEAHLIDCPHCQLDLLELQDLPGVLDKVRQTWPAPPLPLPRSPARATSTVVLEPPPASPPRRRVGRLVAAAAVLLVIAGPLVTLAVLASASPGVPYAGFIEPPPVTKPSSTAPPPSTESQLPPATSSPSPTMTPRSPSSPEPSGDTSEQDGRGKRPAPDETGSPNLLSQFGAVNAQVSVKGKEWGSKIDLELSGVIGPLTCQLLAVSEDGSTWVVAGWSVPDRNGRAEKRPKPLHVTGGTALEPEQIARFEVRSLDGALLTVVSR